MLTSLAAILRYSIHKSNEIVEIQDELEYLKKYVYLQQQRFDYSFICTIDVEEGLRHYRIHKLMIQPLLENTLVHAFPGNTGMDEVNIRIGRTGKEGMLEIVVEDNGVGMSPEQVELFNHFDYQKEKIESSIRCAQRDHQTETLLWGTGKFPCGILEGSGQGRNTNYDEDSLRSIEIPVDRKKQRRNRRCG